VSLPELPRAALKRTWPKAASILQRYRPAEWPVLLGGAVYRIITANQDVLAPPVALRVVLEAAVPMSKLNPATVEESGVPAPAPMTWSMRAIQSESQQQIIAEVRSVMPAMPAGISASPLTIARPAIAFVNLCGTGGAAMAAQDRIEIGALFGDNV